MMLLVSGRWQLSAKGHEPMNVPSHELAASGYAVLPNLIAPDEVAAIARLVDNAPGLGTRRLLDVPWCSELAETLTSDERLRDLGTEKCEPVQCTLFKKSAESNWLVSLHQDLSIPVAERVDSPKCSGWSEKEGRIFVQPPIEVLQQVLAVRVHLDDCDERNGALRVVPGSHRLGRLAASQVSRAREDLGETTVPVPSGGAMLLRPLLLHASSKSVIDTPRRVLHFVFGPRNLPEGLRWRSPKRPFARGG